ncbi:hypothetical protein BST12_22620 [Mycobacterium angelicum]|uniref:Uncharacterized protein n=1 Tax=Mycobacterium angelicum TaxID=470074 RepID=A0A1W9ZH68_MYCAN|nr:hypothetical protein BST12_22620 [Mycobacterium angelicum]
MLNLYASRLFGVFNIFDLSITPDGDVVQFLLEGQCAVTGGIVCNLLYAIFFRNTACQVFATQKNTTQVFNCNAFLL